MHWKFDGGDWTYGSSAELEKNDGGWTVAWRLDLLLPGFQDGDALKVSTVAAPRAEIVGDGGDVLVTSRPVIRVGIDKSHLDAAAQPDSAKALATLVDVDRRITHGRWPPPEAPRLSKHWCFAMMPRGPLQTPGFWQFRGLPPSKTVWNWPPAARLPVPCWAPSALRQRS